MDAMTPLRSPRYVYLRVSIQVYGWPIWFFGFCAASVYQMVGLLCNVFKNHGTERPSPADLRAKMILFMNATENSVILLRVSSFSPSTSRSYSPLISAGSGFGLATPGLGASPSLPLAAGGSGEDIRDFRIGLGITTTNNTLQLNNARPGLYNSSVPSCRVQTPYQGFKVPPLMGLDHKGRYGELTSGDES